MTVMEIFETMDYGPAPESAEEATAWLERHERHFELFIGGKFQKATANERFDTLNPATQEVLASAAQAGAQDVDAAVAAAKGAFTKWSALTGHARARYLYAIARQLQKHARLFAVLETLDNGKTIRETRDLDIPLAIRHFYHHAGWAQLKDTEFPETEPLGVCGQIIPWNFPLLMLAWKVAPALAMGNTVVLKPAEYTPLTALLFAQICQDIGLPAGVFNVLTGDGRTGKLLVKHPEIAKIAFTGSTEVGKLIRAAAAGSGKRLSLELGGKSPFIVFEDADLDSVAEGVVDAIWFNQGEVCCAGSRLLVQEGVAPVLTEKLRARMHKLRIGNPLDKGMDMGAIVAEVQLERIRTLVNQAVAEGVTCYQSTAALPESGYFFPATLFTGVEPAATIAQEEIFGPVLVASTFRTPAEAAELANHTRYGLAASVWTENINVALDMAPKIKAGVVWINCTNQFDAAAGFGGYKESGFGREGGREGLYEYLKPRGQAELKTYLSDELTLPKAKGAAANGAGLPPIDRTPKLYIGDKQTRPDSGYSLTVLDAKGTPVGEVGAGNRKDVRNAVEAARKASSWSSMTGHARAQVLYYLAENLASRASDVASRLQLLTGATAKKAEQEVEASTERLFFYAAMADKYDGRVHGVPLRGVTLAMPEALGVLGVVCPPEAPLLSFVSLIAPAMSMGNRVVALPSPRYPLIATDFYQLLDTSDVPGGALNIITGEHSAMLPTLAQHEDVDGLWYVGSAEGSALVERESISNLKRTWVNNGKKYDWFDAQQGQGDEYLRRATQVKNIWVPYGA